MKLGTVVAAINYSDAWGILGNQHFIFLTEIKQCPGHCVLTSFHGDIETMIHTNDLYEVDEEDV